MDALAPVRLLAAVLTALIAAGLILASGRRPNVREGWTLLAAFVQFGLILSLLPAVLAGSPAAITLLELSPGVRLGFRADALGMLFALSASLLYILTAFYAIGYMRGLDEHRQTRFFACLAVCLSATVGLALAANLLTFIVCYEVLTIATWPLVTHKGSAAAEAAGRKYLLYLLPAGMALIPAAALTLAAAGTLDFAAGGILTAEAGRGMLLVIFALFVFGFGVKAGVMPFHGWLPTAMIAPTPVSALLHAVAVVKAGVFGIARVAGWVFSPSLLQEIGAGPVLAVIAGGTIVLASLLALRQDDLKARLAYSTVGHLSYIVLGTALFAPAAFVGALFHIVAHAVMKITLFFCAGAIYVKTGLDKVSQLDGIGRQMPVTMAAFGLGALGLAGLPGLSGFLSKWYLGAGAAEAGQGIFLAILLVSGLLNAGYLFPVVTRAFFRAAPRFTRVDEGPLLMVIPLAVSALLAVLFGVAPDAFFGFFRLAADAVGLVAGAGGW